ncbi:MAG: outer membrane protein assembly factor BamD [Bacteroidota bacterium]
MKKLIYLLFITLVLQTCSEYSKVLKNPDITEKFRLGTELFESGKYKKANRLFAQIVPNYRGKPQAEKLMYMYAKTFYFMGEKIKAEYFSAAYQLERFKDSYPKSEKAEEAFFLSAKSSYFLSPVYSKDQTDTVEAIEKLQLFVNQYPNSEYLAEANQLIKELDFKLEKKAFEIAKQYNTISRFKASIKAFNNFLLDFPGATLREDALYWRFNSEYNLARLSVEARIEERIALAEDFYNTLIKAYPETKYLSEAQQMMEELNNLPQEILIEEQNTKVE